MTTNINISTTTSETLGDRVEITSHDEFLGPTTNNIGTSVPHSVAWEGSFRGCTEIGEVLEDFTLVFERLRLAGKGFRDNKPIFMHGKFSVPEVNFAKLAVSMIAPKTSGGESRAELRLDYADDVNDFEGTSRGPGFIGDMYRVGVDEKLLSSKVVLWVTPPEEKVCGYFDFVFTTPMCGLEHTGSFPLWHGVGAEIKRVQGQAALKGMRPGDVIRSINQEGVRTQQRSRDISQIIKAAPRPCVVKIFRELMPDGPLDESLNPEDLLASKDQMLGTFDEMESITARLKEDMMASLSEKRKSLSQRRLSRQDTSVFATS